jgi:hypothetical protein
MTFREKAAPLIQLTSIDKAEHGTLKTDGAKITDCGRMPNISTDTWLKVSDRKSRITIFGIKRTGVATAAWSSNRPHVFLMPSTSWTNLAFRSSCSIQKT